MSTATPPYRSTIGTGAPGASVNKTLPYFDSADTYAKYVYNAGAWHKLGGVAATTLAGLSDVLISSPADGQKLTYDFGALLWENV